MSANSSSGQFFIHATAPTQPDGPLATNRALLHLEPSLVAVSAERIKQNVWRELETSQPWRSTIVVTLVPPRTADGGVVISSDRFPDGWRYLVLMPRVIERERYVQALTHVVLLELANRSGGPNSAETPAWLVEGLARQLLASKEAEIILTLPSEGRGGVPFTPTVLNKRWDDPLKGAHDQLTRYTPLTFQELSWPAPEELTGEPGEVYRSSAQLFVVRLLRLDQGRACMRAFLAELTRHYNWQFAFLRAFHARFERPVEVEKWWALQVAEFTGRDPAQAWPTEQSWQKLEEAVSLPVQVRTGTNELPFHAQATLQNIIRDWNRVSQTVTLLSKLQELELARHRVSKDLVPLVDGYYRVIATYLQQRDKTTPVFHLRSKAAQRYAAAVAVAQLDGLDSQRQVLHPPRQPTTAAVRANSR